MTLTNNYISLGELKGVLGIDAEDTSDDVRLEIAISAACRLIDAATGRRFWTTTAAETRSYTPDAYNTFFCPDDINDLDSLSTDTDGDGVYETVWTTNDYRLNPPNAALDGKPYTYITTTPTGNYTFPSNVPNSVQLVGKFGWGATSGAPEVVKQAALLQAARFFRRKDATFGVQGSGEFGTLTLSLKLDPDVVQLLLGVTRRV